MKKFVIFLTALGFLALAGCSAPDSTVTVAGSADLNVNDNTIELQATVRNGVLYLRERNALGTGLWAIYDPAADYSVVAATWVDLSVLDSVRTYPITADQAAIIDEP